VKRSLIPITALIATAVMAAAALAAAPTVKLAHTSAGKILVNGRGFTVFVFSKDGHNKDVCMTKKDCPSIWPAVTTTTRSTLRPRRRITLASPTSVGTGTRSTWPGTSSSSPALKSPAQAG
jgi:hypothetical protein